MIDVQSLLRPFEELAQSLGTGDLGVGGADAQLAQVARQLDSAGTVGAGAVAQLAPNWTGASGELALAKADEIQQAAGSLGQQSGAMEVNLLDAAGIVLAGVGDLAAIGASYLAVLANAEEMLKTPIGQLTLLKETLDHLSPAIGVVIGISEGLSGKTAEAQALGAGFIPPSAPGTVSPASFFSALPGGPGLPEFGSADFSWGDAHSGDFADAGAGVVGGGVDVTLPDGSVATAPNQQAADAVRNALSQQGVAYSWGGTTPGVGFDCSGFTQWAYGEAGVDLPRTAQEQGVGQQVNPADVKPGDLAVWSGHVAMVVGNGQMIEAGNPVGISAVRTDNLGQDFYGFYRPTA
jgi:cell wall-associated NlpC family hydrolase